MFNQYFAGLWLLPNPTLVHHLRCLVWGRMQKQGWLYVEENSHVGYSRPILHPAPLQPQFLKPHLADTGKWSSTAWADPARPWHCSLAAVTPSPPGWSKQGQAQVFSPKPSTWAGIKSLLGKEKAGKGGLWVALSAQGRANQSENILQANVNASCV